MKHLIDRTSSRAPRRPDRVRFPAAATVIPAVATLVILASWSAPARADVRDGGEYDRDMRVFHIATGARLSGADGTLLVEPTVEGTVTVIRHIGIGMEISGGSVALVSGKRTAYSVAPMAEAFYHLPLLEVYGRVGMPVQFRSGAQVPDNKGLAVYGGGGLRLRMGEDCPAMARYRPKTGDLPGCWTLGVELRAQYNASGGFLMMPAVLPSNTGIISGGMTIGLQL